MQLTEKSRLILEEIAKGHTYEQILIKELAWTYQDIFQAAAEALQIRQIPNPEKGYAVAEIRLEHPRAYEAWSPEDDGRLRHLFQTGSAVKQIASVLQRQPSAVRSRLAKLNLLTPGSH
jgi:hypothetical protein